jgi:uncharacterized protein (DUF2141 family)
LTCTALLASSVAGAAQLTVDVVDVERLDGHVMIAVYDDADAWEASKNPVATARDRVTGSTVRVLISDLVPGRYAVRLFHDENNNGRLDTNMLGIPVENYGFSNDGGSFGTPSFDDAAFELREDTTITISLQ